MNACPIESYRQGDVLVFRDRTVRRGRTRAREPSAAPVAASPSVDIGETARGVLRTLAAVDRKSPKIDREVATKAIQEHIAALGLPEMSVRWVWDVSTACQAVLAKAWSAAWSAAGSAARSAARSAAESAAWSAARSAAWSAARSAAESAAWSAARSAAGSAAGSAAWSAARSAAESAAESAAWSAARSAARSAAESAAWSAAWSAASDPRTKEACAKMVAIWLPFARAFEAGLWLFWVCADEVIAVPRPSISVEGGRLHREDGPAVEWPTGERYFFWRGLQVPEDIILAPEAITVARIDAEQNAELRRVMVDRFGAERYLRDSGAKLVHEDSFGKLLRKDRPGDDPILMVEVVNKTAEPDGTFKVYMLRVHPELRPMLDAGQFGEPQKLTAHNAVASTFGLRGEQYAPVMES